MHWREILKGLRRFEPAALSFERVGAWPLWAKSTAAVLVFGLVLGAGYPWYLAPSRERLVLARLTEDESRRVYERKAAQAATLWAYHARREPLETTVAALHRQLPRDAEIPDLLEDITAAAAGNGLVVRSVDLKPERRAGFYAERPMEISVEGGYHQIGAFVSRVASLPRIVTLHDFDLEASKTDGTRHSVRMQVLARIYWRLDEEDGAQ